MDEAGAPTQMGAVHSFSAVMQNILYHSNLELLKAVGNKLRNRNQAPVGSKLQDGLQALKYGVIECQGGGVAS
jgi:hypothetical protein